MADTLSSEITLTPTAIGLAEAQTDRSGFTRRRCGRGWTYLDEKGVTLRAEIRRRCEKLAIPPAWQDVWIAPSASAHIQAYGTDEAGRRQYIYHPLWTDARADLKFDQLEEFGLRLPRIRKCVRRILHGSQDEEALALAGIVSLLDLGGLRIGSERYQTSSGTVGATTLSAQHIRIDSDKLELDFPAKGGTQRHVELEDEDLIAAVKQCQKSDAEYVFARNGRPVSAGRVNDFLEDCCGARFTAKTFRTWKGSVAATSALKKTSKPTIKVVSEAASDALGNTPAIARKSYIHPRIIDAASDGLESILMAGPTRLRADERRCFYLITR
ncbi:hypothetical protein [Ponticaulis sp.]|uniref:DNA topoisomerase IB n=1 Tax=Ponticaulis sp. TaxID=2020902 RepID=UPI0026284907|nr:hypothetical protein [Ponticaulis sp.]MDF1681898.1 hypothetical protein [Ponticaulis sp.]